MVKGWKSFSSGHPPRATLLILFLLSFFPAFLQGCSETGSLETAGDNINKDDDKLIHSSLSGDSVITKISLGCTGRAIPSTKAVSWWLIRRVDSFVFCDDEVQRLDSYKRSYAYSTDRIEVESGSGDKLIVVIANSVLKDEEIASVNVYEDLTGLVGRLACDSPEYPLMTGETACHAGDDVSVMLSPLMSEVYISSLRCKMEGQWQGKSLSNVKVYLTNVNGQTEMLRTDGFRPSDILNMGRLSEADMQGMTVPGMLYSYLGNGKKLSGVTDYGSASLYCYPHDAAEEGPGTPYTTLVIEGQLDGKTTYYPIRLNRPGYGYSGGRGGIGRNIRYQMDITLTRPGTDDPDGNMDMDSSIDKGTLTLHPGNLITAHDGDRIHVWVEVYPENTAVTIDEEDLIEDKRRGIYDYEIDPDGKGVWLTLLRNGSGAFIIEAGPPVNDGVLVIVVVNP